MVNGDDTSEIDQHIFGSALNPNTLHGGNEKKEIAKPLVKMEVKAGNRAIGGGAVITEEQK